MANGIITIPRSGVYRLSGFANIKYLTTPTPSGSMIGLSYILTAGGRSQTMNCGVLIDAGGAIRDASITLPCPIVSLYAGYQIGMRLRTNVSCSTTVCTTLSGSNTGSCGLQVEFLY